MTNVGQDVVSVLERKMVPKGAQRVQNGAEGCQKYDKHASKNQSSGEVAKSTVLDAKIAFASLRFGVVFGTIKRSTFYSFPESLRGILR